MSENLGAADSAGGPEYLDAVSGDPLKDDGSVSPTSGLKRGLLIGGAIFGAAAIGAGAWAATSFFATGAQPAEALPASTLAYVSVDVDPSGDQMLEAYQFAKKFPVVNEELGLDDDSDLREKLFQWIQDEGICLDVDYANDIEPWLGTAAAIAAVTSGDKVAPVAVIQIEDAVAAEAGLKKLQACEEGDESGGWAIADGWAVIAEKQSIAEDVVAATAKGSLADSGAHTEWLDELGDQGIVTMYVAPNALEEAMKFAADAEDPAVTEMLESTGEMWEDFAGMAATVRFDDDGLELVAASGAELNGVTVGGTQAGGSVADLPADTAAAFGVSIGDDYAEKLMGQLSTYAGAGAEIDEMIAQFEAQLGLTLPEDLQTLLGESVVMAVSGEIDIDQVANSADGADVPVGLKITGDADGIESVLEKLGAALGPTAQTLMATDVTGEVVAIGPSADYRKQLLADGSLGESDKFADVVGDTDSSSGVFYVDFDAADNWLDQAVKQSGDSDMLKNIEPLVALGLNATVDDGVTRLTLRLATE